MSVASTALDVAKFLRERKGIKEEQRRYEQEFPLKEGQIKQQMAIALQQAEREKARMAPGGVETRKILSAPYGIGTEEARPKVIPEGMGHKLERLQGLLAEKQVAGYETPEQIRAAKGFETPEQRRVAEQDWEEKIAGIRQQYALELADLKGGTEEETIPFDESGAFNTQIFAKIAEAIFPNYSLGDVYKNIGLEEVRKQIRLQAVANYGQNDPAKVQQIESSLDEWLRFLFQMMSTSSEEDKNQSFGQALSKIFGGLSSLGGTSAITQSYSPYEGLPTGRDVTLPGAEQKDLLSIKQGVKPERRGGLFPGLTTGKKRKERGIGIPGLQTGQ